MQTRSEAAGVAQIEEATNPMAKSDSRKAQALPCL